MLPRLLLLSRFERLLTCRQFPTCLADTMRRRRLATLLPTVMFWLVCAMPASGWAHWTNGDFSIGVSNQLPPGPWMYTPLYNGNGVTLTTPMTQASLNLGQAPGSQAVSGSTHVVKAPLQDPEVLISQSPPWGDAAAVINMGGKDRSVNKLSQTATMEASDVDPADGLIHLRLAMLPVLELASHTDEQQPYVYIEVSNVTQGNSRLFSYFLRSNQPGMPWQTDSSLKYVYTAWQGFDVALGSDKVQVGDQLVLTLIVAGCSLGGHEGHAYVTGVGSFFPPGLTVEASAPSSALNGTLLTYDYKISNTANNAVQNLQFQSNTPPGTTFESFTAPPGMVCNTPATGATGIVSCTQSMPFPAGGQSLARMGVRLAMSPVAPGAVVTHNEYSVRSSSSPWLLGPALQAQVLDPSLSYAVTLSKLGTGSGSVNSSPGKLDCSSACTSASTALNNGEQIVLTAQPDIGNYFAGWSGACSGTSDCSLTMQGSPLSLSATFVPLPLATANIGRLDLLVGQAAAAIVPVSGSGGTAPLQYSISPALPSGLTLDSDTGLLHGTPNAVAALTTYTVTVSDAHGATASNTFALIVDALPVVTGVSPNSGSTLGGTSVTIAGHHFSNVTGVFFGGTAARSFSVIGTDQIQASSPAVGQAGLVDITVSTGAGSSPTSNTDQFNYLSPINGSCGSATHDSSSLIAPVNNLCSAGNAGVVLNSRSRWSWTCTGSQGGSTASCSSAAPGHAVIAGTTWTLDSQRPSGFVSTASVPSLPAGYRFPQGLVNVNLQGGAPGSTATVTINYAMALPSDAVWMKYNPNTQAWGRFNGAVFTLDGNGNTVVTLTLTDGGAGDDDGQQNGSIADPGGAAILDTGSVNGIPTLDEWARLVLICLMPLLAIALAAQRRRRAQSWPR